MHFIQVLPVLAGLSLASPVIKRDACQPVGGAATYTPSSPDTPEAFTSDSRWATAANTASDPSNYVKTFGNFSASNNANDYLGHSLLQTYDVADCAARCNNNFKCQAFNIYFSRDPSVETGAGCENPASSVFVKCVLWGGPVDSGNANNQGGINNQFSQVYAGSNGYIKQDIVVPTGFGNRQYFGNKAIDANQYAVGYSFYQGTVNAETCAQKCREHTNWAANNPGEKACKFFNVFYQYIVPGDRLDTIVCSMYDRELDASVATNVGQWRGSDQYLPTASYGFTAN
ncbi:Hypothetical protein D9617_24g017490 [Elsinoe fawcettii]|nr:Hypothetical protein D9617_24g017490 [Elsinoe fawcettii]